MIKNVDFESTLVTQGLAVSFATIHIRMMINTHIHHQMHVRIVRLMIKTHASIHLALLGGNIEDFHWG